jgi:hypothetical protein
MLVREAIEEILNEFTSLNDGDKQIFKPEQTEAYQTLVDENLQYNDKFLSFLVIIDNLISGYRELCDQYGDLF